jgi:putative drug exporter of the RND superfamily
MTRIREEVEESPDRDTRRAAVTGLAATGGVITSAGLVLAGTFAVLVTLPLTSFAEIGFAVAFGVLLDTLVVRSILVIALTVDIGRWMWWPSRLSRVIRIRTRTGTRAGARAGRLEPVGGSGAGHRAA